MKKTALVAPLYKGLVQNPEPAALAVMTKRNPETGNMMSDQAYVMLMQSQAEKAPELVQDVARATAAAVLAYKSKTHLISVEGCPQQVGENTLTGSSIMEHIWTGVVPRKILHPNQLIIEDVSGCTIEEVRAIMAHLDSSGSLDGVTHEYHQARTAKMFEEEKRGYQDTLVRTPAKIAESIRDDFPKAQFIRDVIAAGEPTEEFAAKERKMEWIYGPLHSASRMLEKGTFGRFNLEKTLAERMRK